MINALAERVFDRLDDQTRLSEHMNKRSWKLGWGRMETVLDAQQGRSVGSHIVIRGRVFRVRLYLDEVVAMREPQPACHWSLPDGFRPDAGGQYREALVSRSTTSCRPRGAGGCSVD